MNNPSPNAHEWVSAGIDYSFYRNGKVKLAWTWSVRVWKVIYVKSLNCKSSFTKSWKLNLYRSTIRDVLDFRMYSKNILYNYVGCLLFSFFFPNVTNEFEVPIRVLSPQKFNHLPKLQFMLEKFVISYTFIFYISTVSENFHP